MPNVYVVDTCSFFELKRFPTDVFPTLRTKLDGLVGQSRVIAPREVYREIEKGDDEVREWARARPAIFIDLDTPTTTCLEEVLRQFAVLRDTTRLGTVFADPLIVALCLARSRSDTQNSYVVVTEEALRGPGSLRIPNLCQPFGLQAIKFMDLFRRERLTF